MALYPCPECKREISTDAKRCPLCGKDVRFAGAGARWRALPKAGKVILICGVGILLIGVLMDNTPNKKPDVAPAVVATAPAAASSSLAKKTLTVQPGDWIGYKSRELMDRAVKLATQGDRAGYSKLMGNGIARGLCTMFKPGEEVFLEDTAMLAGVVKVRRQGELTSWWTNYEAVKSN